MRIIGAGLGRTGTSSLKQALEYLLQAPCYHMTEVFENLDHIPLWRLAARGGEPDWHAMFRDYQATVDWPAASFWPELSRVFPEAIVVLSTRDPESWWTSASRTIFQEHDPVPGTQWREMWEDITVNRFTNRLDDKAACLEAFNQHYARVRESVPKDRLLVWSVCEGWKPLCDGLNVDVPDIPFPHKNTTQDYQEQRD
jgi:hypothetical protein